MYKQAYEAWLRGKKLKTYSAHIYRIEIIESYYGDLDTYYERDKCKALLAEFRYTKKDVLAKKPATHRIPIKSKGHKDQYLSYHDVTKDYRARINKYVSFRDDLVSVPDGDKAAILPPMQEIVQDKLEPAIAQSTAQKSASTHKRCWHIKTISDAGKDVLQDMLASGVVSMGASKIGDLDVFYKMSREAKQAHVIKTNVTSRELAALELFYQIGQGDIVISTSHGHLARVCQVVSDYKYSPKVYFAHTRKVQDYHFANVDLVGISRTLIVQELSGDNARAIIACMGSMI
jgi:hypothetical protein